jgi:hypothetical protein
MSNLDLLLNIGDGAVSVSGKPCLVARTVNTLADPYKTAVTTALTIRYQDGGATDFEIGSRMRAAGLQVGDTTINRHRNNKCTCPKEN